MHLGLLIVGLGLRNLGGQVVLLETGHLVQLGVVNVHFLAEQTEHLVLVELVSDHQHDVEVVVLAEDLVRVADHTVYHLVVLDEYSLV